MNVKRLRELVALLRALPPERFDYGTWVGKDWQGDQALSCGTTACALGWAIVTWGKEYNLQFVGTVSGFMRNGELIPYCDAASMIFDLAFDDSEFLFIPDTPSDDHDFCSPSDDASAQDVADHIERFLDRHVEKSETAK